MKQLLFVLGLMLFSVPGVFSQDATPPAGKTQDSEAKAATELLTAKYALTPDQAKQMYTIQLRKQRNLSEIESLKTSDPVKYNAKIASIQNGATGSIKRLLKNKDQQKLFQQTQAEVRRMKAQKRKEMVAKGASKEEIDAALNLIYTE